ncbi:MAG: S-formylglutathione hydrolase [Chromatiales bacterium]|nr:MAG: S-formylglutathione hydrolase [Chromatiales bacterium]
MDTVASHRCFGGTLGYYRHASKVNKCDMRFSAFVPLGDGPFPVLWWLSGLTCTEENFTVKAGAYRYAMQHGVIVVAPDTSPRGDKVPDDEAYDLGQGAGFYVNALQKPWKKNFQMYSYVTQELPELVFNELPADEDAQGIFGHSMGGHGALTIGLKHPDRYKSISAFAPIVAPTQVPWGQKAFSAYLGDDQEAWKQYDACELMRAAGDRSAAPPILVDQGLADTFLAEQLRPELFEAACAAAGQRLILRRHEGYDHSYFFMASFIDEHIEHHAGILSPADFHATTLSVEEVEAAEAADEE